jgi:hypothetical protein
LISEILGRRSMLLVESLAIIDLSLEFSEALGEFVDLVLVFLFGGDLRFERFFGLSGPWRDVNLGNGFHGVHSKVVLLLLLLREQCGALAERLVRVLPDSVGEGDRWLELQSRLFRYLVPDLLVDSFHEHLFGDDCGDCCIVSCSFDLSGDPSIEQLGAFVDALTHSFEDVFC